MGGFEEILLVPANVSPTKARQPPVAGHHRVRMCQLAFEGWSLLRVLDLDIQRSGPTYTIDTLQQIAQVEGPELRLIIASELARELHSWRHPDQLLQLAPPWVFSLREGPDPTSWHEDPISRILAAQVTVIPSFDVSSTEVRERLRHGQWCGHLVPQNVLHYIHEHQLYLPPQP